MNSEGHIPCFFYFSVNIEYSGDFPNKDWGNECLGCRTPTPLVDFWSLPYLYAAWRFCYFMQFRRFVVRNLLLKIYSIYKILFYLFIRFTIFVIIFARGILPVWKGKCHWIWFWRREMAKKKHHQKVMMEKNRRHCLHLLVRYRHLSFHSSVIFKINFWWCPDVLHLGVWERGWHKNYERLRFLFLRILHNWKLVQKATMKERTRLIPSIFPIFCFLSFRWSVAPLSTLSR